MRSGREKLICAETVNENEMQKNWVEWEKIADIINDSFTLFFTIKIKLRIKSKQIKVRLKADNKYTHTHTQQFQVDNSWANKHFNEPLAWLIQFSSNYILVQDFHEIEN